MVSKWWYHLSMEQENPLIWPRKPDQERINRYQHSDKLYYGNHYDAFSIKAKKGFEKRYEMLRYVTANFAKIVSNVMADMLFGEQLIVDVKNDKTQAYMNALIQQNDLISQLWESAVGNSRRGDAVFKLRVGKRHPRDEKMSLIFEEFTPAQYFPAFGGDTARNVPLQDVIAHTFKSGNKTILHKETHEPGYIFHETFQYDQTQQKIIAEVSPEEFGYKKEEQTKVKRSLIFHIPNVRDGSGFFGTSDYGQDLESLFFALNNRLTKTDNILDKHSDPILAVPPGVLDENGRVKKESLGMFEVDNETPGFSKPEYIVWNANLESAENQIDKLIEMLYMFSEVAPATMGLDKNGAAESGRALKFRMIATIRKRNRKIRMYDATLKSMLLVAQQLGDAFGVVVEDETGTVLKSGGIEVPSIKWSDKIINDEVEAVDMATARIDNGTLSRADAITRLDGMDPAEAKLKVKEIDEEAAPAVADVTSGLNGGAKPKDPANTDNQNQGA